MILYFANRQLNVLGQANTTLPDGFTIIDDNKTEDIETGVKIFECEISFKNGNRSDLESWAEVGNYLLRSHKNENEFYQIIDVEIDTKKQRISIYAEDDGLDLLNEVVGAYEASQTYPISHYIKKYTEGSGWTIGINEIEGLTRKLSFDSEQTTAARILKIAEQFDNAEISYSFEISGLMVTKKYINIYQNRGSDNGVQLRLNKEIDSIVTTKTISNLATALQCTGGTPDNAENPITLKGFSYDDGDFYVEADKLKSRKALEKWQRYLWKNDETLQAGGHIVKQFSYDTTSQTVLCEAAIEKLKTICDMEINFEADITHLPDNVGIGDRVDIIDDGGDLYVSTRILTLETSVVENTKTAVLGEHLIKKGGISQKVADLAEQFAKNTISVSRALSIATTAKEEAEEAQSKADSAVEEAGQAQTVANEAKESAEAATQSAGQAQATANEAQAAVDVVEESVSTLEKTVTEAKNAAENAQEAAGTATQKAEEAKTAAENAASDATEAKESAETAQGNAEYAIAKSEEAKGTAASAIEMAETASQTAANAKADAEQAEKDVATLGENLETLSQTMKTDYTRKTEFTETTANLQTQITQNADELSSTAKKVVEIDETANNAADLAEQAQNEAAAAQTKADQATSEAQAAQTAADNAQAAAVAAQSEANTAKAAAETAQSVADQAEAELEAAKVDLATVTSRVDATEEEIATAKAAVDTAQKAADQAKADAETAAQKATEAQSTANTAVTNAETAQSVANNAASQAALAQQTADAAKGDAEAAQTKANEAATAAAQAQQTANTAKTNADNAQAAADEAARKAAEAQTAADDADAKVEQAAANLATAQQNLADVTSRVDATEEEVEAAQAAVETAQAAADKAKQDAAAAQKTADVAKTNADNAQTAANNAKTAADNAQAAADDAKAAADKAQADVDGLAVRVTTAETSIKQNSEAIELRATKTELYKTYDKVTSKGEQLIVNGSCLMCDNTNFSAWLFDGNVANNSPGSFTMERGIQDRNGRTDEFIPINTEREYTFSLDVKSLNKTGKIYSFLDMYDIDGLPITSYNHMYAAGSLTTLAQDLKQGDTVVYLTDISKWDKTKAHHTWLSVWNYKNSFGYTYPKETYTRNVFRIKRNGSYIADDAFDTVNKTITLEKAYSGETIPAGTHVSQGVQGSGYKYMSLMGVTVPTEWTRYSGTIKGVDFSGTNIINMFSPGIAMVKIGFLWNYYEGSDAPPDEQFWITNLSLYDTTDITTIKNRVIDAETLIRQNSEKIELTATKEEVSETIGNYYTKEQTNAEIEVSADGIKSEVSEIKTTADNNKTKVAEAHSLIDQLSNMIQTLVVGENGESLMTQTENGWQFDFSTIQNTLASHASQIANFDDHIKFSTFEGEPCIELCETSTDFKVLITNKRILFQEGSAIPTYICDNTLVTENIEVKEEIRQSGWVWKVRPNGNIGLSWKGVIN